MSSTTTSHNRVDPNIKRDAEQIIKDMGLTISDAHELFYRQIIAHQGLPFELRVPNKETIQAMQEAKSGAGKKYSSVQEMLDDL